MDPVQEHKWLEHAFRSFYARRGYTALAPVRITSRIDPTVYLVNSATNLFKQYIADDDVCVFAIQPSMRTQILCDYYSEENETEYPTCFDSYGAYVSANHLQKLIDDSIAFFSSIGFDPSRMRIRASYDDPSLTEAAASSAVGHAVEMDRRSEKYSHIYGGNVTGRAIKLDYYQEWQHKHKNLCYFILMYENGIARGVEMATSDQLILMRLHNLQYAVSVAAITDFIPARSFPERRLADSISGAAHLLREGLRPNSSNTNGRTLKKYLNAVSCFGSQLAMSPETLAQIICAYVLREYGTALDDQEVLTYLMCNAIRSYDNQQ